jgi:hypothetical protein
LLFSSNWYDYRHFKRICGSRNAGDETIDQRISMLKKQNENIQSKVNQLMSYQAMINHKINWYSTKIGHSKICPREGNIENRMSSE